MTKTQLQEAIAALGVLVLVGVGTYHLGAASASAQKMNIASYNKQTRVLEAFKRRDGKLVSLGKIRFQSRWNAVTTAAMVVEDAATKVEKEDICNDLLNPF